MKPGEYYFALVEDLDTMTTAYQLRRVVQSGSNPVSVEPITGTTIAVESVDDEVSVSPGLAKMITSYARFIAAERLNDITRSLYDEAHTAAPDTFAE